MKNRKSILVLIALLSVTLLLHLALHYQGGASPSLMQRTYLLTDSAHEAFRIRVTKPNTPEALLVRTKDWRLIEPYAASVDENVVLRLLDALSMIEIDAATGDQELLSLGRTREDFGLTEPLVKVSVATPKGTTDVSFGVLNPAGDGHYASVGNEQVVYVISTNAFNAVNLTPDGFRRRALFSIAPEDVLSFDIKRGSGSFMRFVRDGNLWQMQEPRQATASAGRIKKLLEGVVSASATDFIWPTGTIDEPSALTTALLAGYGLDPESAVTLTLKCDDGLDRMVSFGKEATAGLVYALAQEAGAIMTVPAELKDATLAETSAFTDTRLFPLEENAFMRVSIADAAATYLLSRNKAGVWMLEAPVAAATDEKSVSVFLNHIQTLRLEDVAATGVTVSVSPGEKSFTVSAEKVLANIRLADLRSREILKIKSEEVRRLVVTTAGVEKPTAVVYDGDRRAWNVESAPEPGIVNVAGVTEILKELASLQAASIVKLKVTAGDLQAYGLDNPTLTVAIDRTSEDTVRRNILIGGIAPGGRYATVGASDAIFVLPEETVQLFMTPLVKGLQ